MDYEKKQRLIALRDSMKSYGYIDGVEELVSIFPDLVEDEEDRIRSAMIRGFNSMLANQAIGTFAGEPIKNILSYIEKMKDEAQKQFNLGVLTGREEAMYELEKEQKDASKAIEAVERIDKYIDENVTNAHDMKDSNPDKKYYRGWDDALGKMAGILEDVYSGEMQKEQNTSPLVQIVENNKAIVEDIRNGVPTKTIEETRGVKFATPIGKEQKPLVMAKIDTEKAVEILNKINVLMKIQHRSYLSNELEHIINFIESNTKNG